MAPKPFEERAGGVQRVGPLRVQRVSEERQRRVRSADVAVERQRARVVDGVRNSMKSVSLAKSLIVVGTPFSLTMLDEDN